MEYAHVIKSLLYLTNYTRSDLPHSVNVLSRYTCNPRHKHWKAITIVLHYLRYTKNYGLQYGKEAKVLEGCSDANWILDFKKLKLHEWIVFTLGNATMS